MKVPNLLAIIAGIAAACLPLHAAPTGSTLLAQKNGGAAGKSVTLAGVSFTGNTVFSAVQLEQVLASQLGTRVSGVADLEALANRVETFYAENGYPNTTVVVPQQEISSGRVKLQVVEPKLGEVRLTGTKRYSEAFLEKSFRHIDHNGVLSVTALERQLLLVGDYPGLAVKASLQAGKTPGTTDVVIEATEADRLTTAQLDLNNFGSEQTSKERINAQVSVGNLTGHADALTLGVVSAFDPNDVLYGQLHYSTPLNTRGTTLGLYGMSGSFEVGKEFTVLGLKGEGTAFGLSISHPLVKRTDRTVSLDFGFDSTDSELKLLGARSSYDQIRAVKLGVSVEDIDARTQTRNVGAAALHFGLGDSLGGMADNDPLSSRRGADNSFTKFTLEYGYLKQYDERNFLVAQLAGQLTSDPLVAGEQFDIGGANTVRGYPQSELLGDTGERLSLEWRHTPKLHSGDWLENFQTVAFVDLGHVSNKNPAPGQIKSDTLTGVGVGLRAELADDFFVRADLGYALSEAPSHASRWQPYIQIARRH